jgi:hypothetical protein
VKLEMFVIADRKWLEQGIANVLGGIKICNPFLGSD